MKNFFIPLLIAVVFCSAVKPDNYQRNHNVDVLHYTFNIILSDSTKSISGNTVVEVRFLTRSIKHFNLDLDNHDSTSGTGMIVTNVSDDGRPIHFFQSKEKLQIILDSPSLKDEIKKFSIQYSGIPKDGLIISKNKFGDRTFFGDNWPNRAHYWLPTIDHPYDKATCDFYVTAPSYYQVIANGSLADKINLNKNFTLTQWKESKPIASYLMVIGAARFAVQYLPYFIQSEKEIECIPVETWVYPQDKEKGFYDFSPAEKIIKLFTKLIGPFPYEKLANVESKTIYGGMENASNIFYSEQEVTGTRQSLVTVAHETAHQWFGDAVTEDDWNHIWLSEGFATFFQNVFIKNEFGKDSLINSMKLEREQVINYNKANPNSTVIDTTIIDLINLLNINSYQKGSWVLRILQHLLGEKDFWKGIQLYYKTYRNKNALTKDFENIMEKASGKNLKQFFDEWIYKPGFPILKGGWKYNNVSKILSLTINQSQLFKNSFRIPLDVGIYTAGKTEPEIKTFNVNKKENIFNIHFETKPARVTLDPGTWLLMKSEFEEK